MRTLLTSIVGLTLVGVGTSARAEEPAPYSLIGSASEETLRDAALKVEREAAEKFDPKKVAAAKRPESLSAADQERYRLKWLAARAEALPLWADLLKRFPNGHHSTQAMYHAGILYAEAQKSTAAVRAFDDLLRMHPLSDWSGDAAIRQIDVTLDQQYDARAASVFVERALKLAESQQPENKDGDAPKPAEQPARKATAKLDQAGKTAEVPAERRWGHPSGTILNELYFRAGLLCYLREDWDGAVNLLHQVKTLPVVDDQRNLNMLQIGLRTLRDDADRKKPAWEEDAIKLADTNPQKMALQIADTLAKAQQIEKAEAIYRRVLAGDTVLGNPNKAVTAYCQMQLAGIDASRYLQLAVAGDPKNEYYQKMIDGYRKFFEPEYGEFSFAAAGIMRMTLLEYNTKQDAKLSLERFQHLWKKYPNYRDAERVLYFLALTAVQVKDKPLAEASCREFLQKFPNSGWKPHVAKVLAEEVPKIQDKPVAKEKQAKP